MEESVTYQAIMNRGRAEGEARGRAREARHIIRLQGDTKFGPPDPTTQAALDSINDPDRLEVLATRLLTADSWADLLAPS